MKKPSNSRKHFPAAPKPKKLAPTVNIEVKFGDANIANFAITQRKLPTMQEIKAAVKRRFPSALLALAQFPGDEMAESISFAKRAKV